MRMQAAVVEQFGAPPAVQEIEPADPGAGEVLVRLVACGVCHTDLYTASGADYAFEATGLVGVMRQAVEAARMGCGLCTVAGVAGKGGPLDVVPRLLITGRRIAGSPFGGVKGRDQVAQLVQRYLDAQDGIRSVIEFD